MFKKILLAGSMLLSSVGAFATDVAYTAGTGFTGTFDLTPYYSSITIIVAAIAVVSAIKLALNTFKRV